MRLLSEIARRARPIRRRLTPQEFKESHVNAALKGRRDACYLEIGVRAGGSFRPARAARKIAIDPVRYAAMQQLNPGEEFFEMTSDHFFAGQADTVLGGRNVDVALIDGLHEFDHVLRDFYSLEGYMKPDGVIFIDDCNPRTRARAEVRTAGPWNGDVWRLAALLVALRPDLRFVTLDCDQGLGMATGFGAVEPPALDEGDVAYFRDLDYEVLDTDRAAVINLRRPVLGRCWKRARSTRE